MKAHLKTYGCQMNVYDSEVAKGVLLASGYNLTETEEDADILLLMTCSVRKHAEGRVFGKLHEYAVLKGRRPNIAIGVLGCMAEYYKETLLHDFPKLDFVCGTKKLSSLPALIDAALTNKTRSVIVGTEERVTDFPQHICRKPGTHAWLPIMTGCNQFCSYCVVPYVRGREVSKNPNAILKKAEKLVSQGYKRITLLGQNVNRYGQDGIGISFPELLDKVAKTEGLERLGFLTSHPRDANEDLFRAIQSNPNISRRFHLPLQSGSDRILKLMNRGHTIGEYRAKVELLRKLVTDINITTDFIVGFPSEAEAGFESTLNAAREIQFDGAYIFKYSRRETTQASSMDDDVPEAEKQRRHKVLLDTQNEIRSLRNRSWVGKVVSVLAEAISYKNTDELIGRTLQEKKVVFKSLSDKIGKVVRVRVNGSRGETLLGSLAK